MCNYTNPTLFGGIFAHCCSYFCSLQIIAKNLAAVCQCHVFACAWTLDDSKSLFIVLFFPHRVWHSSFTTGCGVLCQHPTLGLLYCGADIIWYDAGMTNVQSTLYSTSCSPLLLPSKANMHEMLSYLAIYTWVKRVQFRLLATLIKQCQHKSGYFLHSITQIL